MSYVGITPYVRVNASEVIFLFSQKANQNTFDVWTNGILLSGAFQLNVTEKDLSMDHIITLCLFGDRARELQTDL